MMFGIGIGNATSLPPLIAQVEFVKDDVSRVVALVVSIGQATYAFAPAVFGLVARIRPMRRYASFAVAALVQASRRICVIFAAGRYRS